MYNGVSAYDRSATIRALVTGNIKPSELARPGHIFPLYGHENGVLGRDGHTEALLDLTRMAGLTPGGALIEILNQDGTMGPFASITRNSRKVPAENYSYQRYPRVSQEQQDITIYKVDMALNQRRVKILDLIREDGHAKVQELSRIFNVTDVTIRQDLEALEKLGYIQREHGGAFLKDVGSFAKTGKVFNQNHIEEKEK